MKEQNQIKKSNQDFNYPGIVSLRMSLGSIITAIIMFVLSLLFLIASGRVLTNNIVSINNISNTHATVAVYGSAPLNKDCFVSINSGYFVIHNNKHISAEVLMVMNSIDYQDNLLGYSDSYSLTAGECLVSKNLLVAYSLKIGDMLNLQDYVFTIAGVLPEQTGVDPENKAVGIVLLAENKDLLNNVEYQFCSFVQGHGYVGPANNVIFLELNKQNLILFTALLVILLCGVLFLLMLIMESMICAERKKFYKSLFFDGVTSKYIFVIMLKDLMLKYILPTLLAIIIVSITNTLFSFFANLLCLLSILIPWLMVIVIVALVKIRRLTSCRNVIKSLK